MSWKLPAAKAVSTATGVTKATVKVAVNPWAVNRVTFREALYDHMDHSLYDMALADEVEACENCKSDLRTAAYRKGQTRYSTFQGKLLTVEESTHCEDHIDKVRKHQNHYRVASDARHRARVSER